MPPLKGRVLNADPLEGFLCPACRTPLAHRTHGDGLPFEECLACGHRRLLKPRRPTPKERGELPLTRAKRKPV